MFKFFPKAVFVLFMALVAVIASAQSFDDQIASIILLQDKAVQKDIGITEQQRAAMNKYADAHRAKLAAYYQQLQKTKAKEDEKKLLAWFQEMKHGVLSQMSPAQVRRLREISLQYLDFTALADRTVGAKVGLSAAQHEQIDRIVQAMQRRGQSIEADARKIVEADPRVAKAKTQQEKDAIAKAAFMKIMPRLQDLKAEARKQVLAVLTPTERAAWQQLLGKPFQGA